jgi:chemotaxis protein MotB
MDEVKVVRVVGLSSAVLFDKSDPFNPINRRISIIVLNKKAEEAAQQDGGSIEVDAEKDDASKILGASGVKPANTATAPSVAP